MRKDQCLASSVGPRVKPEDCARMLRIRACFVSLSFAGLVVLARSLNPIPSRTRPLNSSAPMVLWLKPWESRSLPGLPRTKQFLFTCHDQINAVSFRRRRFFVFVFCVSGRRCRASARWGVFSGSNRRQRSKSAASRVHPYFAWGCFRDFCPGGLVWRGPRGYAGFVSAMICRQIRRRRSSPR
jgi:hypothetical protein